MRPTAITYRLLFPSIRQLLHHRQPSLLLPCITSSSSYSCRWFSVQPDKDEQKTGKEDRNQKGNEKRQDKEQLQKQIEEDIGLNDSYTNWQRIKFVYNFVEDCGTEKVLCERIQAYEDGRVM